MPNQTIQELQTAALAAQQAEQKRIDAENAVSREKIESEAIEFLKTILDPFIPKAFVDELNFHYGIRKGTEIACGYLNYRGVLIEISASGKKHFAVARGSNVGTIEDKDLINYILTHELVEIDQAIKTFNVEIGGIIPVESISKQSALDSVQSLLIKSGVKGQIQYWIDEIPKVQG
jgi:hypothetical protein